MQNVIDAINATAGCRTLPPTILPTVISMVEQAMPDQVKEFYTLAGGAIFHEDGPWPHPFVVLPPEKVVPTNQVLLGNDFHVVDGDLIAGVRYDLYEDATKSWYVFCDFGGNNSVSTNFNPKKHGECYKTFWSSYALVGYSTIVSNSIEDLLVKLLTFTDFDEADYFWESESFVGLGDAYDS